MLDMLMRACLWLHVGVGSTHYWLMCIFAHRKHAEMQYHLSIYRLLDMGGEYKDVG